MRYWQNTGVIGNIKLTETENKLFRFMIKAQYRTVEEIQEELYGLSDSSLISRTKTLVCRLNKKIKAIGQIRALMGHRTYYADLLVGIEIQDLTEQEEAEQILRELEKEIEKYE